MSGEAGRPGNPDLGSTLIADIVRHDDPATIRPLGDRLIEEMRSGFEVVVPNDDLAGAKSSLRFTGRCCADQSTSRSLGSNGSFTTGTISTRPMTNGLSGPNTRSSISYRRSGP